MNAKNIIPEHATAILVGRRDEVVIRTLEDGIRPFPVRPAYHPDESSAPDWGQTYFALGGLLVIFIVTALVMHYSLPVVASR